MEIQEILKLDIDKKLIHKLEEKFIMERKIFPYMENDREIFVVMENTGDINSEMFIKSIFKKRVIKTKIKPEEFYLLIRRYFGIGAGM